MDPTSSSAIIMNETQSDAADNNLHQEDHLGALQNVDLQLVLAWLVQKGTLTSSEQQVVLRETSKQRQSQILLHFICNKGLHAMENLLKCPALLQQQPPYFSPTSRIFNNGQSFVGSNLSSSSSCDTVTGSNREEASISTHYSSTSQSTGTDSSHDRSPLQRSTTATSGAINAPHNNNLGHATCSSLQDEISKAIEEKFGPITNGHHNHQQNCDFDHMVASQKAFINLPPIPELPPAVSGYHMKSPKLANRNVDTSSSSMAESNMVTQLLAYSAQNGNRSGNYINGIADVIDGAAGGGPGAGAGGGMNESELDQWDFHEITLAKLPPYGFGIAVSGGRDNPHFANGDPSIAVSDVLNKGPAEGRLFINDRIISVNGTNLENVDYSYAVGVLKDSPATVNLLIKRRCPIQPPTTPNTRSYASTSYTVTLPKPAANTASKKKEDFGGLVFGCILYVKDISNRTLADVHGIQIGDTVLKIGATSVDHLTFNEVKKVLEKRPKDRLPMVFQRPRGARSAVLHNATPCSNPNTPPVNQHRRQSSQNVYTELPTKTDNHVRQKSVDSMEGKLVNPNRSGERTPHAVRSSSMNLNVTTRTEISSPLAQRVNLQALPHKSFPDGFSARSEGGFPITSPHLHAHTAASRHELETAQDTISLSSDWRFPDPRFISFRKDGSVGLRLTGGNEAGIFIAASQPGSPAAVAGLVPGDKILKVNDKDMKGVTREEAVLFLLNLNDQIEMVVQQRKQEFDYIIANQIGDSFYIRTHFTYEPDNKTDLNFLPGDTFRVMDTLHTGSVGSWFVTKIGPNKIESAKGSIPSASRAEELAKNLRNGSKTNKNYSNTLADRIRRRSRRTKSLTKDQWDEVAFAGIESKFPAYERIVLKMSHFQRPVVFYGPLADIAREKLVKEFPERYASPQIDSGGGTEEKSGIVRLSVIRQLMSQNKHCVLDLTCQAVDRLNYAQMYPVVIFLKGESKDVVKEIRTAAELKRKSTKKLIIEAQKLEKQSSFLFTGLIPVKSKSTWFRSVCEMIEQQQQSPIWMSEKPPENALADDFLFPMATSSLYSCASSGPESDAENLYDTAPMPPPRRVSRDDGHVNGVCHARSPPLHSHHQNHPGPVIPFYKHSTPNLSCDFPENRGVSQNYQAVPFKSNMDDDHNHANLFATLRSTKPSQSSNFSRRPRPPPITVPTNGDDRFASKPTSSVSFADLPSISNGAPSMLGTYEDPKSYDPYKFTRSTTHSFISATLDRNNRHHHHPHQMTNSGDPPQGPPSSSTSPNKQTHNGGSFQPVSQHSTSGFASSNDIYGRHHAVIREEQAPPLPPKPKYLTNGRLKMVHNGSNGTVKGHQHQPGYGEPSQMTARVQLENTYGKLPVRPFAQKCTARPVFLESTETIPTHKLNGSQHNHDNLPYADDDRSTMSPSQMNFPPPPDDFLNSPKKLNSPEVIAEARGFFDHNGGILSSEETGVSLIIPPGALASRQEIYFKVCREDNILSTLDKEKGERLLSPCVLCGPSGLTFLKPLELKLPHSANTSPVAGSFILKSPRSSVIRPNGVVMDRDQHHASKLSPKPHSAANAGSVSVYVDHF